MPSTLGTRKLSRQAAAEAVTVLAEERRQQMVAEQKNGFKANRRQSSGMGMPILSDASL